MSRDIALCPECQGPRVRARVQDTLNWTVDHMYSREHTFRVLICTKCGHSTFYANGYHAIQRMLEQQEKTVK